MWTSFLFGLLGFASAQDDYVDEDEAFVTDVEDEDAEQKTPSAADLFNQLNSMGLTEEEKKLLREGYMPNAPGVGVETNKVIASSDFTMQAMLLLALLSVIALIFGTILEKLQNSKALSGEAQEKLADIINRYSELKDEEKVHFKKTAKDVFQNSLNNLLGYSIKKKKWQTWLSDSHIIVLFAILIIIFIFVFFGYKLYKSLSERERRREEKRKLKQMKKKK